MDIETEYFTIKAYPEIIVVEAFHSWDERIMTLHIREMTRLVRDQYEGKSYAMLADGSQWELNTPAAEDMGKNELGPAFGQGLTHLALVVGSSPVKKWQTENMRQGFQGLESRIFQTRSQALDWLSDAGYDTTPLI